MTIFVVGLSHHTAPVEVRECLHVSGTQHLDLIEILQNEAGISECVVISTCNRLEIYGVDVDVSLVVEQITSQLELMHQLETKSLQPYLYVYEAHDAVRHLMRIASGLDSIVLGEAQILGQVSEAYRLSQRLNSSGQILSRLFEMAIHAGKRTQNETEIGKHTTSTSHAAVRLALSTLDKDIDEIKAVIIGAGTMSSLAVDALYSKGVSQIDIVNRTRTHANELAEKAGGRSYGWHELHAALASADIVISATSAPHTVIHLPDVEIAMQWRQGQPQVLIDTALPRDIGDSVDTVPGVTYYNIDDLQQVVDENSARRRESIPFVEGIIVQEANAFMQWLRTRQVVPAIRDLRQKITAIADAEMQLALRQIPEEDHEVVSRLVHRIVNKVLHEPTIRLREQAVYESGEDYIHALRALFALDAEETHHVS